MFRYKLLLAGIVCNLWCTFIPVYGQENISGVINKYTVVTNVYNSDPNNQDTIVVDDTTGFSERDIVLIIQMRGADRSSDGKVDNINDAGKFEFIPIREFVNSNTIILAKNLFFNYDPAEVVQLIRVPTYDYAVVTDILTCMPWNDSTGGVLALVAFDSLILNNDINVSGKGFKGGIPDDTTGQCNPVTSNRYYDDDSDVAGRKGDGIITTSNIFTKGSGRLINAGGGDHGFYSGGGGGGNFGEGGGGGFAWIGSCTPNSYGLGGAFGGTVENSFFNRLDPRVYMGGGGGTSTQQTGDLAVPGGNGGGIVIIISREIIGNNYTIYAEGDSVEDIAITGGSGGGAGGAILLGIDTISTYINLDVSGGGGGYSDNPGDCAGAGGGGGGGIIWHPFPQFKAESTTIDVKGGSAGLPTSAQCQDSAYHNGVAGSSGKVLDSLNLPLNGFLFNVVPGDQTICEDETPACLSASFPQGGDGTYDISWEERTKVTSWGPAVGINDTKDYIPPSLTDTTFYRRIVESGTGNDFVSDTSFTVIINVHPLIQDNMVSDNQVICSGDVPAVLTGQLPTGGTGSYLYQWEDSTHGDIFDEITSANALNYAVPALTDTFYYRRRVNSGACEDHSNILEIIVLENISANFIAQNQTVCQFDAPSKLTGTDPLGGNFTYIYQWERNIDGAGWDSITSTLSNSGYSSPALDDTTTYRRIIRSGLNDVCKDTSNIITITVLPTLVNNLILGDDIICEATIPEDFTGSLPCGGDGSYTYQWIWSLDSVSWDSLTLVNEYDLFNPDTLYESNYFSRVVRSGLNDCCKDTSSQIFVKVYPLITNNIITDNQEWCFGSQHDTVRGATPGGGDGTYTYSWDTRTPASNWTPIGNTTIDYMPPSFSSPNQYYYRRRVNSNVCFDYSDSLLISILPLIDNNTISGPNMTCYNTSPATFEGSLPNGGKEGVYRYNWTVRADTGNWNILPDTMQSYTSIPLVEQSSFKRIVKSGLNDCCRDTSAQITVGIWDLPTALLSASIDPDTTCAGDEKVLYFDLTGEAPWTIEYFDGMNTDMVELSNPHDSITIYPDYTSLFQLSSVIDFNGCSATDMTGDAQLQVYEVPVPNPGADTSVCGLSIDLRAIPTVGDGTWSFISGPGTADFDPDYLATTTLDVTEYGEYLIQWEEVNWECIQNKDKVITFFEQPVEINAGDDIDVYGRVETQLNALDPVVGSGKWSKIEGYGRVVNDTLINSEVDSLVMGRNLYLLWMVTNGVCPTIYDSITIYVHPILPPTGFSPNNGDDINNEFEINGLDVLVENELKIFNRWGKIIYSTTNYQNDWVGTNENGVDLPEDTYFYILTGKTKYGDNYSQKGYFVIKR